MLELKIIEFVTTEGEVIFKRFYGEAIGSLIKTNYAKTVLDSCSYARNKKLSLGDIRVYIYKAENYCDSTKIRIGAECGGTGIKYKKFTKRRNYEHYYSSEYNIKESIINYNNKIKGTLKTYIDGCGIDVRTNEENHIQTCATENNYIGSHNANKKELELKEKELKLEKEKQMLEEEKQLLEEAKALYKMYEKEADKEERNKSWIRKLFG